MGLEMVTILLDGAEVHCLTVVELGALDIVSVVLLCYCYALFEAVV